jgi:hypothetical protein
MKARQPSRLSRIFADGRLIDEAVRLGAQDAIRKHAEHDVPVVIWRDGRVALVPARELLAKRAPNGAPRRRPVSGRGVARAKLRRAQPPR